MPRKIDRCGDRRQVLVGERGRIGSTGLEVRVGVPPFEHDGEVGSVQLAGGHLRRADVLRRLDQRHRRVDVVGRTTSHARWSARVDRPHRETLCEHGVVSRLVQLRRREMEPRGVFDPDDLALDRLLETSIPDVDERMELVHREEVRDPVAELLGDEPGVVRERLGGVSGSPPSTVLQRLWQVPVVQRRERLDPRREQLVDQAAVEVDAGRVRLADAVREDPWPGDREPVRIDAQLSHERDILAIAMVVIVRDVPGITVADLPGSVGVGVPDRRTLPVLPSRALDLIRGGRHAPPEPLRERAGTGSIVRAHR